MRTAVHRTNFPNTHWPTIGLAAAAALAAACGSDPATEITPDVETLSFEGTEVERLDFQANGAWEAEATPDWISIEDASGSGDDQLRVTVDRTNLELGSHSGSVVIRGDTSVTIPVLARFPEVTGTVGSSGGYLAARDLEPEPDLLDEPHVPGEVIVRLNPEMVALTEYGAPDAETSADALLATAERIGTRAAGAYEAEVVAPELGLARLRVDGDLATAIEALEAEGHVHYAVPNILSTTTAVDDPLYDAQWHYESINLEAAWDITTGYEEVVVAVIDGDFHPDHPDLVDNFLPGWDFVRDNPDFYTFNESCGAHGTHVAGTVAAVTDNGQGVAGVAPDVKVVPMNVGVREEDQDPEQRCTLDGLATVRAIRWAAGLDDEAAGLLDRPVDVINMSLSSGQSRFPPREDALAFAREEGVIPVAAAGNDAQDLVNFPAANGSTIAVSATNPEDELANYSSFGNDLWVAAPGGEMFVGEEAFPERGVWSTVWNYDPEEGLQDHAYAPNQGTSMASPHVAGVAALVRAANPQLSPSEVQEILAETANPLGNDGWTPQFGYGLIDAGAAVAAARDGLRVEPQAIVVRVLDGDTVVAEGTADSAGEFNVGAVPAGEYTLVAGDERYGKLGVPGTVYGEQSLRVTYNGDITIDLDLTPQ